MGKNDPTAIPRTVRLWENIFTLLDIIFYQSENILPQKEKKINNRNLFSSGNLFSSIKRSFRSRDNIFRERENIIRRTENILRLTE